MFDRANGASDEFRLVSLDGPAHAGESTTDMPTRRSKQLEPPARRPPRRWRWVVGGIVFFGLLGAVAPTIVGLFGFTPWLADRALAGLPFRLTFARADFGWFTPIQIHELQIEDDTGEVLLTAQSAALSKSLSGLAADRTDLGVLAIDSPTLFVACRGSTSNVEQLLAKLLAGEPSNGPTPKLVVAVLDGTVKIVDHDAKREWTLTKVDASVALPGPTNDGAAAILVEANGRSNGGSIRVDATIGADFRASVKAERFPAELADPWLRRADPALKLAAGVSAEIAVDGTTAPEASAKVKGQVSIDQLQLRSTALGEETLVLHNLRAPIDVAVADQAIQLTRMEMECDIGSASATGAFSLQDPLERLHEHPGLSATLDVDVAKLAGRAPKLLRLKPGTQLERGAISIRTASQRTEDGRTRWEGSATASRLAGKRDGKSLAWNEPLAADFSMLLGGGHPPRLDRLDVTSDVLTASASGTANQFQLTAEASLDRLSERLSDFIDLTGVRLAGGAKATVTASIDDAGLTRLETNVVLNQFVLACERKSIQEQHAVADLKLSGRLEKSRFTVLTSVASLTAGQDRAELQLLAPIADLANPTDGRAKVHLGGELSRWRVRLAPIAALPNDWRLFGSVQLDAVVGFEPAALYVVDLNAGFQQLQFRGAGIVVDEPKLAVQKTKLERVARFDRKTGETWIGGLDLRGHTLAAYLENFSAKPTAKGYDLQGKVLANAQLGRMQRIFQPNIAASSAISGLIRGGELEFQSVGDVYTFQALAPMEKFRYGTSEQPTWTEPTLHVSAAGGYSLGDDRLTAKDVRVYRPDGFSASFNGAMDRVSTEQRISLSGRMTYDLEKIEPQLRRLLGPSVRVVGKETRDFRLSGTLGESVAVAVAAQDIQRADGPNLEGHASMGWETMRAFGFDLGKADLNVHIIGGLATADPISATFGKTGKMTVQPTIRLQSPAFPLSFRPGKIVDHAELTPEACADAIGYALPVLARSAQTKGSFSFSIEESRLPLSDPLSGKLRGKLTLHNVEAGPGPVFAEFATQIGLEKSKLVLAAEQTVPIRLENGRIHHENLALNFAGLAIRTSGSSGVDGSLDMTIETPLPESAVSKLVGRNIDLQPYLDGKRVRVPLKGTISNPQVDSRQFRSAIRTAAEDVLREVGRKTVDKAVDRAVEKGRDKAEKKIGDAIGKLLPFGKKK